MEGKEWKPHLLEHCVDSHLAAIALVAGSAGVVSWYIWIAFGPWLRSARECEGETKRLMQALVLIFLACGGAGYLPTIISYYNAELGVYLRIVTLAVLNIVCPYFLVTTAGRSFRAVAQSSKLGRNVDDFIRRHETLTSSEGGNLISELKEIRRLVEKGE